MKKLAFSTCNVPFRQRFAAWRGGIASLFDVHPHARTVEGFESRLYSYQFGDEALFVRCESGAQHFERGSLRVVRDNLDHYLVQVQVRGMQSLQRAGRETIVEHGDLMVIDLADPHVADTTHFTNLSLLVPRHLLAPRLLQPDSQGGRVLKRDKVHTGLAVSHMHALARLAETMTAEEARHSLEPTLGLLANALNGGVETADGAAGIALSLLSRARLAIEQNLQRSFTVEELCRELGLSRATLYSLFEPVGGVRAYVQERRLRRSAEELTAPLNSKRHVYEIAFDWGFGSEAHFSRAFKRRFGVSPSDARHGALSLRAVGTAAGASEEREYANWLAGTLDC
ncbi:MAG TPA: helix-turn-helix domain-containing protein [Hyphomicrobiales bacterium]|nr:helix-turn-helix domain-containing protein [Hyphomicrobiales bacterium]